MPKSDGLKSLERFIQHHYADGESLLLNVNGVNLWARHFEKLGLAGSTHVLIVKGPPTRVFNILHHLKDDNTIETRPHFLKRLWLKLNEAI